MRRKTFDKVIVSEIGSLEKFINDFVYWKTYDLPKLIPNNINTNDIHPNIPISIPLKDTATAVTLRKANHDESCSKLPRCFILVFAESYENATDPKKLIPLV